MRTNEKLLWTEYQEMALQNYLDTMGELLLEEPHHHKR